MMNKMVPIKEKKIPKTFKLRPSIIRMIDEYAQKSNQEKGDIIETAVAFWLLNATPDDGKITS